MRSCSLCAFSSPSTPACSSSINSPLMFSFYLLFLTNLVNSAFHFLQITSRISSPALLSNFPAIQYTHKVLLYQNAKYLHRKEIFLLSSSNGSIVLQPFILAFKHRKQALHSLFLLVQLNTRCLFKNTRSSNQCMYENYDFIKFYTIS